MSNLRQLKVTFDSFDDLVESIGPGLSRTHLFAPTDEEIPADTRVRLEIGTVRKGAAIRGVAKVASAGEGPEPGLHLHLIHLDPSSTRLVDSIVRGEVVAADPPPASGRSPFDIRATEPGPESEEVPAETAVVLEEPPKPGASNRIRRFAWPLALSALAVVFFMVFDRFTKQDENRQLLTGRDRQTEVAEPAIGESDAVAGEEGRSRVTLAEEAEQLQPAAPEPAAPEPAAPEPAAPEPAAPDPSSAIDEVEHAVRSWAAAWSRQDAAAYLELYAPDYSLAGLDRATWESQRRVRITAPERLEIRVGELQVEAIGPERAIARFHQLYITEDKTLAARKVLELEHSQAGWKIVAERLEG